MRHRQHAQSTDFSRKQHSHWCAPSNSQYASNDLGIACGSWNSKYGNRQATVIQVTCLGAPSAMDTHSSLEHLHHLFTNILKIPMTYTDEFRYRHQKTLFLLLSSQDHSKLGCIYMRVTTCAKGACSDCTQTHGFIYTMANLDSRTWRYSIGRVRLYG